MDINKKVALNIMSLREEKGILQKDFAAMIEMSKSTYCDKENGKSDLTIKEISLIATALDVSISFLLGISESNNQSNNNSIVLSQNNNGSIYFHPSSEVIDKIKNS